MTVNLLQVLSRTATQPSTAIDLSTFDDFAELENSVMRSILTRALRSAIERRDVLRNAVIALRAAAIESENRERSLSGA